MKQEPNRTPPGGALDLHGKMIQATEVPYDKAIPVYGDQSLTRAERLIIERALVKVMTTRIDTQVMMMAATLLQLIDQHVFTALAHTVDTLRAIVDMPRPEEDRVFLDDFRRKLLERSSQASMGMAVLARNQIGHYVSRDLSEEERASLLARLATWVGRNG